MSKKERRLCAHLASLCLGVWRGAWVRFLRSSELSFCSCLEMCGGELLASCAGPRHIQPPGRDPKVDSLAPEQRPAKFECGSSCLARRLCRT